MRACLPGLAGCLIAGPALAADPQALSTNLPVQVRDALVVGTGTFELQGIGAYDRDTHNSAGADLWQLSPTLKIGPLPHMQLDLSFPYSVGSQSGASQGNGTIDGYYQFTEPGPLRPALAVQGGYQYLGYGAGHKSAQYFVRALATQWLGDSARAPRLHLNFDWTHVTQPSASGRSDILEFGAAYSQLVTDDTAVVADIVHGAKSAKRQNQTIIDVGLRHVIGDAWALGAGIGAGLGAQSPAFRVFLGVQRDFVLF